MTPTFRQLLKHPVWLLAFGFGSGLVPRAPGTAGTVLGVILAFGLWSQGPLVNLVVLIAIIVSGSWICGRTATQLGVHDHGGIVWDEIAGVWLTVMPFWWLHPEGLPLWLWLMAFGLFRLFDIWKPWPINWLDRHVGGGLGIMLDDLLAGVYACIGLLLSYFSWVFIA